MSNPKDEQTATALAQIVVKGLRILRNALTDDEWDEAVFQSRVRELILEVKSI